MIKKKILFHTQIFKLKNIKYENSVKVIKVIIYIFSLILAIAIDPLSRGANERA